MLWPAAVGLAVYLLHSSLLSSWVVDDAGISYAYARSLAQGHGLVAQPGVAPVEGFTNLLWVLLLALPMRLGVFDPIGTPKLLAGICVALAFALVARLATRRSGMPPWLTACALVATAAFTGFSVWCASGLENGAYALSVAALATVAVPSEPGRPPRAALAGFVAFIVFCTRPDGALYFWIPALLLGFEPDAVRRRRSVRSYVAGFVLPWLALTAFRVAYFHDVMPNTFYAKKGEGVAFFGWVLDRLPLPAAALSIAMLASVVVVLVAWGFARLGRILAAGRARDGVVRHVPGLFFATALLVHQALPGDWMGQYRFATPAFLFGPVAVLALAWEIVCRRRWGRAPAVALGVTAVMLAGLYGACHTPGFVKSPTISFTAVRDHSRRIAAVTAPFVRDALVLTPDIGGALWENRFQVLDLVGLVDRPLARHRDRASLRAYILNERRPDAVWLHSGWLQLTGFEHDSDFGAAYVPVWQDRLSPGEPLRSGLWLRRDLTGN